MAAGESVLMPGVWDPLSALLAQRSGFSTVFLSGYCLSAAALGVPDVGLLTQTEVADAARRTCAAVPDTAVIVDGDTGYGGVTNAARTVALWEQAGAAGVFIEDQVAPSAAGTWPARRSSTARTGWPSCGRRWASVTTCTSPPGPTPGRRSGSTKRSTEAAPHVTWASTPCSSRRPRASPSSRPSPPPSTA
ncbi:MAG: isocitrate lyase/PEP mutase family protein [Acidimicrobiales bacterium]